MHETGYLPSGGEPGAPRRQKVSPEEDEALALALRVALPIIQRLIHNATQRGAHAPR